jgi:hypothetical protein
MAYSLLPWEVMVTAIVMYPGLPEIWSMPGTYIWVAAWVVALASVWITWKKGKQ